MPNLISYSLLGPALGWSELTDRLELMLGLKHTKAKDCIPDEIY